MVLDIELIVVHVPDGRFSGVTVQLVLKGHSTSRKVYWWNYEGNVVNLVHLACEDGHKHDK